MASLELVPNPRILAVQMVLFLAALLIVKKFLLEPYLLVRRKRERSTGGQLDDTEALQTRNKELKHTLDEKSHEIKRQLSLLVDEARRAATHEREKIMRNAEKEAAEIVRVAKQQLTDNWKEEKKKVPELSNELANQLVQRVLD